MLKALAKDPQQRFESVQTFAQALEQATQNAPNFGGVLDEVPTYIKPLTDLSSAPVAVTPSNNLPPQPTYAPVVPFDTISHSSVPGMELPHYQDSHLTISPAPDGEMETLREKHTDTKRGISRRSALLGLAGLVVAGTTTSYLASSGKLQAIFASGHPHVSPTATHIMTPTDTLPPSVTPLTNSTGTMLGFDLQHTNFNPGEHILSPSNVSRLVLDWTATTGNSVASEPAIANGIVYIGSSDGKLYAFQASSGRLLWAITTNTGGGSSPAVANGVVYIGSLDNNLYACNAATGKVLWTVPLSGQCLSSPAVVNGVVYICSSDYKVYAFHLP